jgi:mannitol/fructose-specific phosphotransferase system IIA component (Ntr-type)/predicted transcriptional regulator
MGLGKYLDLSGVLTDLPASNKWQVIEQLIDALMENPILQEHSLLTREEVVAAIREREEEKPTGIEAGFAFPHGRLTGFTGAAIAVASLRQPVTFQAPDGPAEFVVLMVVPAENPTLALKITAQFARAALAPEIRSRLLALRNPDALFEYLRSDVLSTETALLAGDIMRAPYLDIYPETSLHEVTRAMAQHGVDCISVVEHDGTLVGQITSDHLFRLGMPPFFTQLRTISFIRDFDPFEQYFAFESLKTARDVLTKDVAVVNEHATILEVVFLLAVLGQPKVYVERDGKRIGVIDRGRVLEQIINY